jgi:1,4-dihydroxy-2-naphthoate octaprenyltransferase
VNAAPLTTRRAWWLALRPFSYPASIVPVLVGTAAAAPYHFDPGLFVLAFVGSILIHAGCNLATGFFDFMHGVQPAETLIGGSLRTGILPPKQVHMAAIACLVAGSLCGLVIVAFRGWPILALGFASVLAAYFYTAKPISYGRRGLGEVMVFLFMGVVMVMASYYVQLEEWDLRAFCASLPVGILVANILHANNLRDIDNDRLRHKLTIADAVGRPVADIMLWALTLGAYASVIIVAALDEAPVWTLIVALSIPTAVTMLRCLRETEARALNPLVRNAARLHLHFGMLLALGYALDVVL